MTAVNKKKDKTYEFGPFCLNAAERLLWRDGETVPVAPKVFDTLVVLVENAGRLVTKDDLMSKLWPDTFVEEGTLTRNISDLRKTLGEAAGGERYIETVPRHGYRFVAPLRQLSEETAPLVVEKHTRTRIITEQHDDAEIPTWEGRPAVKGPQWSRLAVEEAETQDTAAETAAVSSQQAALKRTARPLKFAIAAAVIVSVAGVVIAYHYFGRSATPSPPAVVGQIQSLAVLPFRSLNEEAKEDYLGLGIATDIITRVSQSEGLTVRPTSAVRKYVGGEMDALAAARELKVDAVLDGTFMHVGDQLRVSVNLLRVEGGASLWAEKFDDRFTDIFAIQDQVSQQVAQRLRLKLSPAEQARLTKRQTSNPEAYSYYAKGMYHFSNIGPDLKTRPESDLAVDLFKKAIDLDPNYALAHAQLGYAYARTAVFLEDNPGLLEQAKQELGVAERLDPQLAQVHVARYFVEFSQYEGWQVETAIRELRLAQQLDPGAGHTELADLYSHIGLERQAINEMEIALTVDPNNDAIKSGYISEFLLSARPDEALEASKRFNHSTDLRYYLEKRMVNEAEPLVDQAYQRDRNSGFPHGNRALWLALRGKHGDAEAAIPAILEKTRKNRGYHHLTYNIARVYALGGKSEEAMKWLRVTVKEGFPCYPLFARDSFLDSIRKDRAFIQFMAEMKRRWDDYQREFG
ncbi:MAG TPA: winged helix-turn-helix domain-containing protein [Blastocatellia bacterium]|nr:winged helix-turn-helix domain-containing protein [Blastocatellia bacterium]